MSGRLVHAALSRSERMLLLLVIAVLTGIAIVGAIAADSDRDIRLLLFFIIGILISALVSLLPI